MTVLLSVVLAACGGGDGSNPTTDSGTNDNGGSGIAFASIIVEDASGQNLGYYLGGSPYEEIWIYNPSGYMYYIDWSGTLIDNVVVVFSNENCTGTPYVRDISGSKHFGKSVFYDKTTDKLYRYKSSLITQGYVTSTERTIKSQYGLGEVCGNITATWGVFELELTTRSDVGIPDSISAPITLNFQ